MRHFTKQRRAKYPPVDLVEVQEASANLVVLYEEMRVLAKRAEPHARVLLQQLARCTPGSDIEKGIIAVERKRIGRGTMNALALAAASLSETALRMSRAQAREATTDEIPALLHIGVPS